LPSLAEMLAVLIGLLAGVLPARRAASLDAVERCARSEAALRPGSPGQLRENHYTESESTP
jgi:hypothetical protein